MSSVEDQALAKSSDQTASEESAGPKKSVGAGDSHQEAEESAPNASKQQNGTSSSHVEADQGAETGEGENKKRKTGGNDSDVHASPATSLQVEDQPTERPAVQPDTPVQLKRGMPVMSQVTSVDRDGTIHIRAKVGGRNFVGTAKEIRKERPKDSQPLSQLVRTQPSCIIIGAGIAGLAAADELHALGCKVVVLEARDRIGGRCWTDDTLDGRVFDLGAGWIHGVVGNPMAELARRFGVELYQAPPDTLIHDASGAAIRTEDDEHVERVFNELLHKVPKEMGRRGGEDRSLGSVLDELLEREGKLETTGQLQLFQWHCAHVEYATAADIHSLSARNWAADDENAFEGEHCLLRQGYRSLAQGLAKGLDVRTNSEVAEVKTRDDGCQVVLKDGRAFNGDTVLVTLPLGVLKKGAVKFTPPLPPWKTEAIDKLGFGLLNKLVLAFERKFWVGATPRGKYIGHAAEKKGEFYMFIDISDCAGKPTLVALIAGNMARTLEEASDEEIVKGAMAVLDKVVRGSAKRGDESPPEVELPTAYRITRWGKDPYSLGSYSYLAVGCKPQDMDMLAKPLESQRVYFAGEATTSEYPSTVHGAFISGRRASRMMITAWHAPPAPHPPPQCSQSVVHDPIVADAHWDEEQHVCALCNQDHVDQAAGALVGPFRMEKVMGVSKKKVRLVFVHESCASYSPEVGREGSRWLNVVKCIRRGRQLRCTACGQPGATIGCLIPQCKVVMHFQCCLDSDWTFPLPSQGKHFFCSKHRTAHVHAQQTHVIGTGASQHQPWRRGWEGDADSRAEGSKRKRGGSGKGGGGGGGGESATGWWGGFGGAREVQETRPVTLVGLPLSAVRRVVASKAMAGRLTPELLAQLPPVHVQEPPALQPT